MLKSTRLTRPNPYDANDNRIYPGVKHTERIKGQVHERLNIIFIDPHYISRPVPHDHKLVDRELDNYPIALRQGITTLYLRKI